MDKPLPPGQLWFARKSINLRAIRAEVVLDVHQQDNVGFAGMDRVAHNALLRGGLAHPPARPTCRLNAGDI